MRVRLTENCAHNITSALIPICKHVITTCVLSIVNNRVHSRLTANVLCWVPPPLSERDWSVNISLATGHRHCHDIDMKRTHKRTLRHVQRSCILFQYYDCFFCVCLDGIVGGTVVVHLTGDGKHVSLNHVCFNLNTGAVIIVYCTALSAVTVCTKYTLCCTICLHHSALGSTITIHRSSRHTSDTRANIRAADNAESVREVNAMCLWSARSLLYGSMNRQHGPQHSRRPLRSPMTQRTQRASKMHVNSVYYYVGRGAQVRVCVRDKLKCQPSHDLHTNTHAHKQAHTHITDANESRIA